jgi:Glycosyltransferase 61
MRYARERDQAMLLNRFTEIIKRPSLLFRRIKVLGEARMLAKRAVEHISAAVWRVPLDRERTVGMLDGRETHVERDGPVLFSHVQPVAGDQPPTFGEYEVPLEKEYVWRLQTDSKLRSMRITPSGTILVNNRYLLDTDFGSLPGIVGFARKRQRFEVDGAIAPWSHTWATYYEFVIHILAKLCRIKETMDLASWGAATICYPLLYTPYEPEYLSMLGIGEVGVVDTRLVDVSARSIVIANLQSIKSRLPSPASLTALRRAFRVEQPRQSRGVGLYLSRTRGERQTLNEEAVRQLVSSFGLEIVDSIPVSVKEQIEMFREAPLIVSTHGSALTNLVWCAPGTRVIELFSRSFAPPMYAYISQVLGLNHSYLVDDADKRHHWTNMHKHIAVDIDSLARAIES